MKLNAPKQITWIIALILGIVGILATLVTLPVITPALGFWLVVAAWALLLIATITHGL
jgi:protein-S-isoprenylcysteine O-methyltransferase Ste14